jgi:regulator of protease activity HflC (stomatin/prohibitin superfamily)
MQRVRQAVEIANTLAQDEQFQEFMLNTQDFLSARDKNESITTQLSQTVVTLADAAEVLNRSIAREDDKGHEVKIISPVVMPRSHRSWAWVGVTFLLAIFGVFGLAFSSLGNILGISSGALIIPYWLMLIFYILFNIWKNSFVMIPDGCVGLVTKYGRVEEMVKPGRKWIFHPRKQISYIVNITKLYPYNAPIREAPTMERVNASVDLFLQFRIRDPQAFIFQLGGVNGFAEKLQNAISEVTRALIYEQRAGEIYDLVGESTKGLLDSLNKQFEPAVEFLNANITHAEPSSQEYRMDLAAPEMVRVAKEAYTYQYELDLRKKRDEGDLDKELAGLRETLSEINAEIATYEAQMSTAHEKEVNRANAYAHQIMVEAESEAKANAAMLEAQALDIRAVKSAEYPEIFEYRYQQEVLSRVATVGHKLPQVVNVGHGRAEPIDYLSMSRQMLGVHDRPIYSPTDLAQIRQRRTEMIERIQARASLINKITQDAQLTTTTSPKTDPETITDITEVQ